MSCLAISVPSKAHTANTVCKKDSIMIKNILALLKDDEGASLVEYALIVALVSVVAIAALKLLGTNASSALNTAASSISS
jgi:pilus assembly protein Flp/PilA